MKLMLDTHVLLWWLQDDARLGSRARALIADNGNEILVSIASPWEIAIKHRLGKMSESGGDIMGELERQALKVLPIRADDLRALENLPPLHRDPFDHLIIAQAAVERAPIMTVDAVIPRYGLPCIGVA